MYQSSSEKYLYVVVQFCPWFKFDFPLFLGMVIYDNEFETEENQLWTKDKSEPQELHYTKSQTQNKCLKYWMLTGQCDNTHDSCTQDFDIHLLYQGRGPHQYYHSKRTLYGPD